MLVYLPLDVIFSSKLTVFYRTFQAHTFLSSLLLFGTDNVGGQISEHIFMSNGGYCLFIPRARVGFEMENNQRGA